MSITRNVASLKFAADPAATDAQIAAAWIKSGYFKVNTKTHCLMYSVSCEHTHHTHNTHTTHCMLKTTGCQVVDG